MIPFTAAVDDILFTLGPVAGAGRLPGWDDDLAREVVTQFARLAETAIAPADAPADRDGCRLENGRVAMPAGLGAAYRAFAGQGWPGLTLPEDAGGQESPAALAGALTEIFAGASHALQMVAGLVPGAARTVARFGTPGQCARWLPRLASGEWLATMALTEPGAGSDLSQLRTRARRTETGWQVSGEKIFISGGDQDLTPRIVHLVLARSGGTGSGVKGLSLFLVPSHDEAGTRQPVTVTRIEEKMGLHGSPTCQMLFDEAGAELLGPEGEGLRAMFTMMNHARLDVALQGVAHAGRAGAIAEAYAATRRQGRLPGQDGAVTIDRHPDVRRMLDTIAALTFGNRALCLMTLVEMELAHSPALIEFLTPLCKVSGTAAGVRAANLGLQVLGGYGYLNEYGIEQRLRDARVTTIYEGTNGIHAQALAGRLLRHDGGAAATAFADWLGAGAPGALALWQPVRAAMAAAADPAPAAAAFMRLSIRAALARVWARLAEVAGCAPDPARLRALAARETARAGMELRHLAEETLHDLAS
ncbi:acyl-CoA dehydrogenase family protein [Paenirhodobacter enshiensis]|uniref:Acyl-CoA dehydrogenase n=1 Tax=Paenirhodobacter enshiensis TaxID=1105367 RepID=A0A086XRI5_9RHOB|nr:acyl-CoA dehydrogenase family protein [Paenirhodobacter enshiensis]KFI24635.1 acyl-CoA dehydrogenase [Paenirhodobacter enshiensis]